MVVVIACRKAKRTRSLVVQEGPIIAGFRPRRLFAVLKLTPRWGVNTRLEGR